MTPMTIKYTDGEEVTIDWDIVVAEQKKLDGWADHIIDQLDQGVDIWDIEEPKGTP